MKSIDDILIGKSAHMRELKARIVRFAPTRLPVLIRGATGSGKELVARAVHVASDRRGAFVAFNVCALSDTMFEDALFGHVRGAFTGAMADRAGYLAEANGGSIFLDEIGGTTTTSQAKLLRAIETGAFRAVGAAVDRVSDFRVITATNEPLDLMGRDGRFRSDLLHRIAGVLLEVPALARRMEDLNLLIEHFLAGLAHRPAITSSAIRRLAGHSWPGNVRELKHALERAAILADCHTIDTEHVEQALHVNDFFYDSAAYDDSTERRELLDLLLDVRWDTALAAERLGVHRATIYRRIKQFALSPREQPRAAANALEFS